MAYPKEIFDRAHAELSVRRDRNRHMAANRMMEITQKVPEAIVLMREIASTSAHLIKAVIHSDHIGAVLEEIRNSNLEKQKNFANLLVQGGFSANYLEPIYTCKLCKDHGYQDGKLCSCFETILKNHMYERLGVPAHIGKCSFDNFFLTKYPDIKEQGKADSPREYMENVYTHLKSYALDFSKQSQSLLFYGNPGLGKTHLSIAIAQTAIEKGFDVIYTPFHSTISKLEAAKFTRGKEDYGDLLTTIMSCDLLVLDDVGTEFTGPFVLSVLYDIVNTRMVTQRPTIINTNLALGELEGKYTSRVSSRLIGNYQAIPFRGNDIRMINRFSKT